VKKLTIDVGCIVCSMLFSGFQWWLFVQSILRCHLCLKRSAFGCFLFFLKLLSLNIQ